MSRHLAFDPTMRIAACLIAILASACGGGGDEAPAPPPPELLQITSGNQVAVARAAVANFVSMTGIDAVPLSATAGTAQARGLAKLTMHALGALPGDTRARPLAVSSMTLPCEFGGSMTITSDDRDNNGNASTGDVLAVAFAQCRPTQSALADGSLVIDITGISETPTSSQLTGLFTFKQLTSVENGYRSVVNGAANCIYSDSIDAAGTSIERLEMTVAAGGLVGTGATPSFSDSFTHDPGFTLVSTEFTPAGSGSKPYSTKALNGKVLVGSLAARIIINTDSATPVHQWDDQTYPDAGKVQVTGHLSKLRLTVLNTSTVRLELDANDDGTTDSSRETSWPELMPR